MGRHINPHQLGAGLPSAHANIIAARRHKGYSPRMARRKLPASNSTVVVTPTLTTDTSTLLPTVLPASTDSAAPTDVPVPTATPSLGFSVASVFNSANKLFPLAIVVTVAIGTSFHSCDTEYQADCTCVAIAFFLVLIKIAKTIAHLPRFARDFETESPARLPSARVARGMQAIARDANAPQWSEKSARTVEPRIKPLLITKKAPTKATTMVVRGGGPDESMQRAQTTKLSRSAAPTTKRSQRAPPPLPRVPSVSSLDTQHSHYPASLPPPPLFDPRPPGTPPKNFATPQRAPHSTYRPAAAPATSRALERYRFQTPLQYGDTPALATFGGPSSGFKAGQLPLLPPFVHRPMPTRDPTPMALALGPPPLVPIGVLHEPYSRPVGPIARELPASRRTATMHAGMRRPESERAGRVRYSASVSGPKA